MRLILFGSPGSGKGTQATMLAQSFGVPSISLGDILRGEVKKDSDLGKEVKSYMEEGLLVPDELVARVVEENLSYDGFILDGYPRTIEQAEKLDEILAKHNSDLDAFIYLDINQETIVDRLSKRRVCKSCGDLYHTQNMPPKVEGICDSCSSDLMQRNDDKPDVIQKRWEVFSNESQKILDFYRNKGKLIKINGQADKNEIFESIKEKLQ